MLTSLVAAQYQHDHPQSWIQDFSQGGRAGERMRHLTVGPQLFRPVHTGRVRKFACKPVGVVACELCEHSHWLQCVPLFALVFACCEVHRVLCEWRLSILCKNTHSNTFVENCNILKRRKEKTKLVKMAGPPLRPPLIRINLDSMVSENRSHFLWSRTSRTSSD